MKIRKRIIKKIILSISFTALTVFAALTTLAAGGAEVRGAEAKLPALTVGEAVNRAIQNSAELRVLEDGMFLSEQRRPALADAAVKAPTGELVVAAGAALLQNDLSYTSMSGNLVLTKRLIELNVTRCFMAAVKAERELELCDISLKLGEKSLEITKVRAELGLTAANEYETAALDREKELADRTDAAVALEDAYNELNGLIGSLPGRRYELILDVCYEPLKNRSTPGYIADSVRKSIRIKNKENDVQLADYKFINRYGGSAEERRIALEQARRELDDLKKDFEEKIIACRNDIKMIDLSYEANLTELNELRRQSEVTEALFEMGRATRLDVEYGEYRALRLEYAIEGMIFDRQLRMMQYADPDLL